MTDPIVNMIKEEITNNDIVLFMKGSKQMPLCGFSATVAAILTNMQAKFKDIDVLADEQLREGIKKYTDWPTIPQLYVKGEFVGGCDIVKEMAASGELATLLKNNQIECKN